MQNDKKVWKERENFVNEKLSSQRRMSRLISRKKQKAGKTGECRRRLRMRPNIKKKEIL